MKKSVRHRELEEDYEEIEALTDYKATEVDVVPKRKNNFHIGFHTFFGHLFIFGTNWARGFDYMLQLCF